MSDSTQLERKPMDEGELWSWARSVMAQGACIQQDYQSGLVYKTYEHYSVRLDAAAAERAEELWARLKTPNGFSPERARSDVPKT